MTSQQLRQAIVPLIIFLGVMMGGSMALAYGLEAVVAWLGPVGWWLAALGGAYFVCWVIGILTDNTRVS